MKKEASQMEGTQKISRYRLEKAQRLLTEEGRKVFHLAEPLLEGKPVELAIWLGTIQHLLESDLDFATKRTAELYPELIQSDPLWLLTEMPLIKQGLETVISADEVVDFQRVYDIVHASYQNPSKLAQKPYPESIEMAAQWWLKHNIESLTLWQQDRFLARLKKQMQEHLQGKGMLLISTMDNKNGKSTRLNLRLGGLENVVLYPEYMAMIGNQQEITVQKGRMSHWSCIWKAEIVETKGEEV